MEEHKGEQKAKRARVETQEAVGGRTVITASLSGQPSPLVDLITQFMSYVDIARTRRTEKKFQLLDVSATRDLPWTTGDQPQTDVARRERQLILLIDKAVHAVFHPPAGTTPDLRILRQAYKQALQQRIAELEDRPSGSRIFDLFVSRAGDGGLYSRDAMAKILRRTHVWFDDDTLYSHKCHDWAFWYDDPLLYEPGPSDSSIRAQQYLFLDWLSRSATYYTGAVANPVNLYKVLLGFLRRSDVTAEQIRSQLHYMSDDLHDGNVYITLVRMIAMVHGAESTIGRRADALCKSVLRNPDAGPPIFEPWAARSFSRSESYSISSSRAWELTGLDVKSSAALPGVDPSFPLLCGASKLNPALTIAQWLVFLASGVVSRDVVFATATWQDLSLLRSKNLPQLQAAVVLWNWTLSVKADEVERYHVVKFGFEHVPLVLASYDGPESKNVADALEPFLLSAAQPLYNKQRRSAFDSTQARPAPWTFGVTTFAKVSPSLPNFKEVKKAVRTSYVSLPAGAPELRKTLQMLMDSFK